MSSFATQSMNGSTNIIACLAGEATRIGFMSNWTDGYADIDILKSVPLLLSVGGFVPVDVLFQAGGDIGFLAVLQFLHHFIEGKVDHVMMVEYVR